MCVCCPRPLGTFVEWSGPCRPPRSTDGDQAVESHQLLTEYNPLAASHFPIELVATQADSPILARQPPAGIRRFTRGMHGRLTPARQCRDGRPTLRLWVAMISVPPCKTASSTALCRLRLLNPVRACTHIRPSPPPRLLPVTINKHRGKSSAVREAPGPHAPLPGKEHQTRGCYLWLYFSRFRCLGGVLGAAGCTA